MIEAVRQTTETGDTDRLQHTVNHLRFDGVDACLVATSVALTRGLALPACDSIRDSAGTSDHMLKLIDGLAVTFMFNVVNRIANAHDLQPEWAAWRLSGPIQRITQRLMAWGLPLQMPLTQDRLAAEEPSRTIDESLLQRFGASDVSPIWNRLEILPTVKVAIYQLMWAVTNCSSASRTLIDEVTHECLSLRIEGPDSPRKAREFTVLQQLFAEPHRVTGTAWTALPVAAETKLDVLIWVAMLAAVHMLNGQSTRRLLDLWDHVAF